MHGTAPTAVHPAPGRAKRASPLRFAGYAASVWALAFAALSFYWAAGGTLGDETIGPALMRLALVRDPMFIAILWSTGIVKAVLGLLALALVQPWGRRIPRWLLLSAAWGAGALLAVYEGVASLVQHGLMVTGAISVPAGLGMTAARWHLLVWDPWWLLGGILFLLAAWHYRQSSGARRSVM